MATDQAYINEAIALITAVAVVAVGQVILAERGDGDECVRHRSEVGITPKLGGSSSTFNFTKEVKNICQTHYIDKADNIQFFFNLLGRQALIQAEQEECNETVKSCQLKTN